MSCTPTPGAAPRGPAAQASAARHPAPGLAEQRPTLGPAAPYRAATPIEFRTEGGLTVWLVERPRLPLVSICLALPHGAAADPPDQPGLAYITASMLDEGAGDRDALGISNALADLGTALRMATGYDGTELGLAVLDRHLEPALRVLADVVARPRFLPDEWARVSALWQNQLRARQDDPASVAGLVGQAVLYGPGTPYGHPATGELAVAQRITLRDLQEFYRRIWRPTSALLIVTGKVTRADLEPLLSQAFAGWRGADEPPAEQGAPPPPRAARPRLVLVDRPEAPQAVIALLRPGVAAADPAAPLVDLVNHALGGSFTSRLNQNLREQHGWSYGAVSEFIPRRGVGPFYAQVAVDKGMTAPAVRELRAEIERMRQHGLTADEFVKGRAGDVTLLMHTHQTLDRLSWRLAELHLLGLPADHDAAATRARLAVGRDELTRLGRSHLDPAAASVVVVGPAAELEASLGTLGLGAPERWSAEGYPLP